MSTLLKKLTATTTALTFAALMAACGASPTEPTGLNSGSINGTNVPIYPVHATADGGELQPLGIVAPYEGTRMGHDNPDMASPDSSPNEW